MKLTLLAGNRAPGNLETTTCQVVYVFVTHNPGEVPVEKHDLALKHNLAEQSRLLVGYLITTEHSCVSDTTVRLRLIFWVSSAARAPGAEINECLADSGHKHEPDCTGLMRLSFSKHSGPEIQMF